MVGHQPAKFGGHGHCDTRDLMISLDHMIKRSSDFT